jgi:predicted nucleic acid-binding protein
VGATHAPHGRPLSRYLLDSTVLIDHLRGLEEIRAHLRELLRQGHTLCTSCVSVAEVERGITQRTRSAADALWDRLLFLPTTREAAVRAGRYQVQLARKGHTLHTADALIAGTARAHGAIVLTDNVTDFPMRDIRVEAPPAVST